MDTYWKAAFRQEMKHQRMTMAALAQKLEMSLPGLKKVFQKKDISLERFERICQILELDPAQIVGRGTRGGLRVRILSPEADAFLTKEQEAFYLYWLLAVERLDLEEAMEKLRLTKPEIYRILRKLDAFELIRWEAHDRIVLPDNIPFLFDASAKSAMKFSQAQAHALVDECFDLKGRVSGSALSMRYLNIPQEELGPLSLRLQEAVNKLIREYANIPAARSRNKESHSARILLCFRHGGVMMHK